MIKPTQWRIALLPALCLASFAAAHAATLSGYGYEVTYDPAQLGAGWTGALTYDSALKTATLAFTNTAPVSSDFFSADFTFTITPRSTSQLLGSDSYTYETYGFNETTGQPYLASFTTVNSASYLTYTGGKIYTLSSTGTNTFPSYTNNPSAFGENGLDVGLTAGADSLQKNSFFYYVNSSGDNNSVVINENIANWAGGVVQAGDKVVFDGHVYVANVDSSSLIGGGYVPPQINPLVANTIYPGTWTDLGQYTTFGGVLDQAVAVTVSSEVWTPTFLQPGVHHCASTDCMPPENGQYTASQFLVTLGVSAGQYSEYSAVTTPVPEPETYAMMLAGLGLLAGLTRRRLTA